MEKKVTSAGLMGLLIGLILIAYSLAMYFTDLYMETWNQYAGIALFFAAILIAILLHAKEVDNQTTYGKLFGFGFKVTAIVVLLMVIYAFLSNYIFPDVKTRFIEAARENAFKDPKAAENKEAIEKGLEMWEKNFMVFLIGGMIFSYLVIGCIASLIGAAIPKKRPPVAEFENV
jgi:di/tricarboxylate transporter